VGRIGAGVLWFVEAGKQWGEWVQMRNEVIKKNGSERI